MRLKVELQKFADGNTPKSGEAPKGEETPKGEELVSEFANAVDNTKGLETTPDVALLPETGDPMADFTAAVEMERAALAAAAEALPQMPATPAPLSSVPAAEPLAPAPGDPTSSPEATNNLFAEFSSGSLDTDRVMEEMVHLQDLQSAEGADALEGSIDAEKMVAEASGFTKS